MALYWRSHSERPRHKWFRASIAPICVTQASASDPKLDADSQALSKIRNMCAVAMASAESLTQSAYDDLAKGERQRFDSAKRMSLELAKNIADVSYRDAALEQVVELCMKASDIDTARILVRGIQTEVIRERLLGDYPAAFY
jgi:hypothetical protein